MRSRNVQVGRAIDALSTQALLALADAVGVANDCAASSATLAEKVAEIECGTRDALRIAFSAGTAKPRKKKPNGQTTVASREKGLLDHLIFTDKPEEPA